VEFWVLGQFQIRSGDLIHQLRRTKPKVVLALLLAHANRMISFDHIILELWGDCPPRSANANVYTYVSSIRRLLTAPDCATELTSCAVGYSLTIDDSDLDASRHGQLAGLAREASHRGEVDRSVELSGQAVALWRGHPLGDLPATPEMESWRRQLQEQHGALLRDWTDARLRQGQSNELVGELQTAIADDPLCERQQAQLMLALYRGGRPAEALDVYCHARRTLADELGLDPGPSLSRIHRAVLCHDPQLDATDIGRWLSPRGW
jgi:DNA-binding SARP family transcriptional activator